MPLGQKTPASGAAATASGGAKGEPVAGGFGASWGVAGQGTPDQRRPPMRLCRPAGTNPAPPQRIRSHGPRSGWSCPRTGKVPYLIRAPNKVADQKQRRAHGLAKAGGTLAPSGLLDAHE